MVGRDDIDGIRGAAGARGRALTPPSPVIRRCVRRGRDDHVSAPVVAQFAFSSGRREFFSVYLLTFCSFIGMGKGSPWKTLTSMMLGFALAAVGMDTVTGQLRLNFGFMELMRGFDFLIAVIGLFGIGEILLSMEEGLSFSGKTAKISPKIVFETGRSCQVFADVATQLCHRMLDGITPGGRLQRRS